MNLMKRVEDYSRRTGLSVDDIINQALTDWFNVVGDALLETPPVSNLIAFPLQLQA